MFMLGVYPPDRDVKYPEVSSSGAGDPHFGPALTGSRGVQPRRNSRPPGLPCPHPERESDRPMQLPDEAIAYNYAGCLLAPAEEWTPLAELRARHFLSPERLEAVKPADAGPQQVAAERTMANPAEDGPLDAGFIDLPRQAARAYRRKGDASDLGRSWCRRPLKEKWTASSSSASAARTWGPAPSSTRSATLPQRAARPAAAGPRRELYFEGNNADNDALQDLLDLLENTCVDPALRERWGAVVISKSGGTLETAAAYRVFRRELGASTTARAGD